MEATATIQDRIAKKAYEKFEARGKQDGFALEDWILAEREVLGSKLEIPRSTENGVIKESSAPTKGAAKRQIPGMKVARYT